MSIFNFCGVRPRQSSENDPPTPNCNKWDDEYCGSEYVHGLGYDNFKEFLMYKNLTLVFFYHPDYHGSDIARKSFIEAAQKKKPNHTFAAVDCLTEPEVCCRESITNFPYYKLYTKGRYIGFHEDPTYLSATGINQWMGAFNIY